VPPGFIRRFQPQLDAFRQHWLVVRYASWLRHPSLWHCNRRTVPAAVAIGLFAGLVPGPFQMLTAALLAVPLRKNLPIALLVTLYTNPLTIVPLWVLAYAYGSLLLGMGFAIVDIDPMNMHVSDLLSIGKPLGLGLLALAITLAVAGYFAVAIAWRVHVVRAWRRRKRA
jgi:hypothetical protein